MAGKGLINKYRKRQTKASFRNGGQNLTLEVDNLALKIAITWQRSHSIAVAAGIMQMLFLRGIKETPWNKKKGGAWSIFFIQN